MKMTSLQTLIRQKNFKSQKQIIDFIRSARTYIIIDNSGGHNYGLNGDKVYLLPETKIGSSGLSGATSDVLGGAKGNTINFTEIAPLRSTTLEDFEKDLQNIDREIEELNEEKYSLQDRIAFMTEAGITEFKENDYRISRTIESLELTKLSTLEKAKKIAKIFNDEEQIF